MVKDIFKLAFVIFVIFTFSSCSKKIYESNWQSTSNIEDLKAPEWQIPLKYFDSKSKLQYIISNDDKNLYICIRATDEQSIFKIMRSGIQLWIDTTGEKNKKTGVFFPIPQKENLNRDKSAFGTREQGRPDIGRFKKQFIIDQQELFLSGFKTDINGKYDIYRTVDKSISANISWDSTNILTYKLKIPFKTFYKETLLKADSNKVFSVMLEMRGIEMEHKREESSEENSRGGNGMYSAGIGGGMSGGGMHGGGMHGGSHGGGSRNNGESGYLTETNKVIVKFNLATNNILK